MTTSTKWFSSWRETSVLPSVLDESTPMHTVAFSLIVTSMLVVAICINGLAQTPSNAPSTQLNFRDDTWHVSVSPYLWLAGTNGSVGFDGREVVVNQSFSDIFNNLKFGVMGLSELRRGRIGILTDLMYIRLGNETAIPVEGLPSTINTKTSLDTFTLTPYIGYRILGNDRGTIDWIAGGRYYHIGSSINAELAQAGAVSYSATNNWADFVEGGRFSLKLTPRVRAFFLGDAGGGGSVLTWQILGGAGYQCSKHWSTDLAYRRLYFNRQTSNDFGLEQTQQGLVLGITFRIR